MAELEIEEAKTLYHDARFEDAISRLENAVRRMDRVRDIEVRRILLADAYLHLGLAHLALDERAQAKECFRDMLWIDRERNLDPEIYAPKVIELLEEVRAEVGADAPTITESPPGKFTERLNSCHKVLMEVLRQPEWIPKQVLRKSECVAVIPSVKKAAFGFGGRYGRGAVVCRTPDGNRWAPPLMISLKGASFGFQFGGQAADLVLLMMGGVDYLLRGKLTLGGDVTVAVGPGATAATDGLLDAQILTYTRTRGIFAGLSLEGSVLRPDHNANRNVYGEDLEPRELVESPRAYIPEAAHRLVDALRLVTAERSDAAPVSELEPRRQPHVSSRVGGEGLVAPQEVRVLRVEEVPHR
jgi:lipid-binding SYLF domain-containing protein